MSENTTLEIDLSVNGVVYTLEVLARRTLLEVLREELGLTGSKRGCNQGICGACNVLVDGDVRRSCISLACTLANTKITTIEGLENGNALDPVQEAFVHTGAIQCGFCMPGMVIAAKAALDENPNASIDEIRHALGGNLCRCSGYVKVVDAVLSVGKES